MKKFLVLILILIVIGYFVFTGISSRNEPCRNCNVMLVDIDILRADSLPCYGYSRNTAPNICQFAKKSVIFKNNYSTSPWTLPGMFSTITSLYPTFHKIRAMYIDKLSPDVPTMAEVLKGRGYQTFFVGEDNNSGLLSFENGGLKGYDKVIMGQPIEKVIEEASKDNKPWFIHYYRGGLHMPYLLPNNVEPIEKMIKPENLPTTYKEYDQLLNKYLKKHYTDIFQKKAIDLYGSIIKLPEKSDGTKVTELFYKLNGADQEQYLKDIWKPIFNAYMATIDVSNKADVDYLRMMYDSNIKLMDERLGPLFKKLEGESLSKKTITVIMSDHGEAFGEHGTFSHDNNYYQELFWTPLIIKTPQTIARQDDRLTSNIDIFPTILEMVGIDNNKLNLQGESLISKKISQRKLVLSEVGLDGVVWQNQDWRYFLPNEAVNIESSKLYNRKADPREQKNVASEHQELVKSFFNQSVILRSYNQAREAEIKSLGRLELSPEKIKRLQEEGYF